MTGNEKVCMTPYVAAHRLARRALLLFPGYPEDRYLDLFAGTFNTLKAAAANGELKCIAFPLWWPVPGSFAIDDEGNFNPGVFITSKGIFDWLKTFDDSIKVHRQTFNAFWAEMEQGASQDEEEATRGGGMQIIREPSYGEKGDWYADNKMALIRAALDDLAGQPEGTNSEKERIITWIVDHHGGSDSSWRREIQLPDIARVKNEKREK